MNKFKFLLAACACAVLTISCDPNNGPDDPGNTNDPTSSYDTLSFYGGINYGDYYEVGGVNYYATFLSGDAVLEGDDLSAGFAVFIDLNSELTSDSLPKPGVYSFNEDAMVGAFGSDEESSKYYAGADDDLDVTGGTVDISNVEGGQKWVMVLTYEDNSVDSLIYVGKISFEVDGDDEPEPAEGDFSFEPTTVTTENYTFSAAEGSAYGDVLGMGSADYVALVLGNDVAFASLQLNTTLASGTQIPAGTYTVKSTYEANTLAKSTGYLSMYGVDAPSFIGIYDDPVEGTYMDTYYLQSGTLVVAKNADNYTFTLDAVSYYGSTIKATYTGAVVVEDATASGVAAKSKQKVAKKRSAIRAFVSKKAPNLK